MIYTSLTFISPSPICTLSASILSTLYSATLIQGWIVYQSDDDAEELPHLKDGLIIIDVFDDHVQLSLSLKTSLPCCHCQTGKFNIISI